MVVAGGRQNFGNAVAHLDDGNVEGSAAEVVNHNLLLLFLIDTVGKSSGCRLVYDTSYIQTGYLTGVLCSLTLSIREVCRNCDDSLGNLFAEVSFRIRLELLQNHCADFLRGVGLATEGCLIVRTHVALDGNNGVVVVYNSLTLSNLTDKSVAVLGNTYDRWGSSCALTVGDNYRLAAFHNGNAGIGCTKVYTYDF